MTFKQCTNKKWKYGDGENAIENCKKAIEIEPNNYVAYYEWGTWLWINTDYDTENFNFNNKEELFKDELFRKVIDICTAVIENSPQDVKALLYRANAKWNIREYSEAHKDYSRVIEIDPLNIEAYDGRANCVDTSEAIKDYSKIIELDPLNINAYHNIAQIKEFYGDVSGAIDGYSKAIENYVGNHPIVLHELYSFRGCTKLDMNDVDGAIQDLLKAVEVEPTFPLAFWHLGKIYCHRKEYAKAVEYLDKATKIVLGSDSRFENDDFIRQDYSEEEWEELTKYKMNNEK